MCGICGIIGITNDEFVRKICQHMIHRGPDNVGIWYDDSICLGHTRLSIIDTSCAGHQPMSNEDETIWITFNGEIYNFQILRVELEAKGHRFKSNTDTEVIIHLYEEYQEGCLDYLRGMFSFGIWDKRKKKLFAARDRLGIKPFFYYIKGDKFVFSSELKAVLASGLIEKDINLQAVRDYFAHGSVQVPETMIKDVFQLLPAHYLVFEDAQLRIKKYWQLHFSRILSSCKSEQEYISDIRAILDEVVKIRMVSDVPLGAFLSGGIDSSIITALMQRHSARSIKTFSIVFEEEEYDERKFSAKIAKKFATDHQQILLNEKDILTEIPTIFDAMDQPSIDGFNTFVISKAAKSAGLTVALSGLGGDELFAGYPSFRSLPKIGNVLELMKFFPKSLKNRLFYYLRHLAKSKRSLKLYFSLLKCADLKDLHSLQRMAFLPHEIDEIIVDRKDWCLMKKSNAKHLRLDPVNQLSFLELTTYLQNTLLQDTDRMSMANSLEVRVPYLDHLLVEKMFEIPGNMKVGQDYPKRLLIKSIKDLLPELIYNRPKMGFVFPFDQWLRAELKGYCEEKLSYSNLKKISILDPTIVNKIWIDFLNGSKLYNYSSVLAILSFVNWYERNI